MPRVKLATTASSALTLTAYPHLRYYHRTPLFFDPHDLTLSIPPSTKVIKWDRAFGSRVLGDPLLHARLAFNQWEGDLTQVQATHHFALGEAPDRLAAKLENVKDEVSRQQCKVCSVLECIVCRTKRTVCICMWLTG